MESQKILLVLSCNIHWAPFYTRYELLLKSAGINYDLVLWNREGIEEKSYGKLIEFNVRDINCKKTASKVIKFLRFAHFVKKQIKKNAYDKIVFLGTYSGVPALLARFLEREYKGKYWIDLRDLTYENYKFFYNLEAKAIRHSFKTVVSSKGFLSLLPKADYGFIHNIDPTMEEIVKRFDRSGSDKIRVSYIGNLGYWNSCRQLIDALANDERFVMNFIGPNYEIIKEYCESNNITNVTFHGLFKREETVNFYNDTDIIYNTYGNDTANVRSLLSNKLYYALRFRLPILVSKNTYMEEFVKKYDIGYCFDNKTTFADELFNWYRNHKLEESSFDRAWNDVVVEDKNAVDIFMSFIEG